MISIFIDGYVITVFHSDTNFILQINAAYYFAIIHEIIIIKKIFEFDIKYLKKRKNSQSSPIIWTFGSTKTKGQVRSPI